MSKDKRGRPTANSPEPDETLETTGAIEAPEAAPAETPEAPLVASPEADVLTPNAPPPQMIAMQRLATKHWLVPAWLMYLVLWTGSKYGKAVPALNNLCGLKAGATDPKTPDGYAFFGNRPIGINRAAIVIHQATGGNYADPVEVVAQIAPRFPNIKTSDIKLFYKEA